LIASVRSCFKAHHARRLFSGWPKRPGNALAQAPDARDPGPRDPAGTRRRGAGARPRSGNAGWNKELSDHEQIMVDLKFNKEGDVSRFRHQDRRAGPTGCGNRIGTGPER
jgi:hypothetical protein